MNAFHQPADLARALVLLDEVRTAGSGAPLAGGTDVYPDEAARSAWMQPRRGAVMVDISRVEGLAGIHVADGEVAIGAMTTWTEAADTALPPAFASLREAAVRIGGRQIQNRGTIGGNLCNASPAADGAPPLLALDAEVEIASISGRRRLPLETFIEGNRRTALRPGELLTRVLIRRPPADERSAFLKLGARGYLVISIASVAANVRLRADGTVAAARIALGACSPAPVRLRRIEEMAVGRRVDELDITLGPEDGVVPIDDVRASAAYRRHAAEVLVRRALLSCAGASAA
jgi:N-methylhydantoinase B